MSKKITRLLFVCVCFFCTISAFAFDEHSIVKDSTELDDYLKRLNKIAPKDLDSLVALSNTAIKFFQEKNNDLAEFKINQKTGALLSLYGYLNLSENYYTEAIKLAKEMGDIKHLVDVTNSMGVIWGKRGDFIKSEGFFLEALLIAKKAKYPRGISGSYLKIGVIRMKQGKLKEALALYAKVDSINRKYKITDTQSDLTNNKAVVYAMTGDMENALAQFKISYNHGLKVKDARIQVLGLQNIGLVYKAKSDYETASQYLHQAISLAKKSGLKEEELRVSINIPLILLDQGKFNQAEKELQNLLEKSKQQQLKDLEQEIYTTLIEAAETQNNYKAALRYQKKLMELMSEQTDAEKQRAFAQANASLELYQKNAEILESRTLLFQKTQERNTLLGISAFSLALLMGLLFISLRLKKLNKRLHVKREELMESNSVKNKLFSIIGHDLRGPQGAALGVLALIKDGELSDTEQKKYLDMIIKQSKSALAILDDLLLWGQSQIKGDGFEKSLVSLNEVVKKVIDLNAETISEKNMNVDVVFSNETKIRIDVNHISFVIRNLIANAVKFTPNGGNIKVYVESFDTRFVKICVADDGIGLKEDELRSIFDPENISKKGTNNEEGTGLGLTLCKEFVQLNGGKIWAQGNADGGTIICFTCEKG